MGKILEDSIYILPDKLSINNLANLQNEFKKYIEEHEDIIFDGSMVKEIDAAGLQLILSAQKLCILQAKTFSLIEPSNICRKVLEVTGFLELIEDEF